MSKCCLNIPKGALKIKGRVRVGKLGKLIES